jgi:hypothetical protein
MNKLHNQDEYSGQLRPKGGLQSSLCSNIDPLCSSPLSFNSPHFVSEDDALDYLAGVYVDVYFDYIKNQNNHAT